MLHDKESMLIVGGSFDDNGGKRSSLVDKVAEGITATGAYNVVVHNGGYFDQIESILVDSKGFEYIIWWANVPNDKPKIRNVKEINPKAILVTSKRNDNNKYSFAELINRALEAKANLCVQFSKVDDRFSMMVFDPLGNCWYDGSGIQEMCDLLVQRMKYLKGITRQGCVHADGEIKTPDETEFFDIIREYAEVLHELIKPEATVTRFLGNSSFRCQRGFPSFRKDGTVFVSRRNVDKRFVDRDAFVPVRIEDDVLYYFGDKKPSVDTPIQTRLYRALPNINYMLHAHVYIEGAPFTSRMIPCGGLEEVDEILSVVEDNKEGEFFAINLIGHGCIVMSSDVKQFKDIRYISRNMPEKLYINELIELVNSVKSYSPYHEAELLGRQKSFDKLIDSGFPLGDFKCREFEFDESKIMVVPCEPKPIKFYFEGKE